jgi:3-deoxy-D-manno-octulosonate 8-phosphate phosphatase (KDO 8-P phosphatase)
LSTVKADNRERAARVQLIVLDSDGVLTDGRIIMNSDGTETRAFHVTDGFGIRMGQKAGLRFAVISGRRSDVLAQRAADLGIDELHQGIFDKAGCLREITARLGIPPAAVCFVGDDLIDLPAMRLAGFAAAPADAQPAVRDAAHVVTGRGGGRGAVREVVDLVLRAGGRWDAAMRDFVGPGHAQSGK